MHDSTLAAGDVTVSLRGSWSATPFLYGVVIFPFVPVRYPSDDKESPGEPVNPHQIPLEVGDEVYVFEQYIPATGHASIWFRGFIVSPASKAETSPSAVDDSQVFIGIWPANHCQIREQLDDSDKRMPEHPSSPPASPTAMRARGMSIVQEEDEDVISSPTANAASLTLDLPGEQAVKLTGPDGRRVSNMPQSSTGARLSKGDRHREPPPLPALKCGDETAAGAQEPLIDEAACAIREWSSLLHVYLLRRQYALFNVTRGHIEALHAGRRKLLNQGSSHEDIEALRKDLISRLVRGNKAQNLDLIVRDTATGRLTEVDIPSDTSAVSASAVSAARMFSMQVDLAYSGSSTALGQPDHATPALTPQVVAAAAERAQMHHLYVELRALIASFCTHGESAELSFSLFDKAETRYVTEEFCVVLDQHANPGPMRTATLFVDLSAQDMQDGLFLVCRVVKNGTVKAISSTLGTGPTSPVINGESSPVVVESKGSQMLHSMPGGRLSCRRPLGCAVLDLSQLSKQSGTASADQDRTMPIFVPVSEQAFSTLHEDIIGSRTREFEKHARADSIVVRVAAFRGSSQDVVRSHPDLLTATSLTQRLGFPDVVGPDIMRNDVYVKLWSGDFSGNSAALPIQVQRNVQVDVELRRANGDVISGAVSRGADEAGLDQFSSMVFRSNSSPTYGELLKLSLPPDDLEPCHLFLTFRHRSSKDSRQSREASDGPFAFAYLPLFSSAHSFIQDGGHSLVLYRYDSAASIHASTYMECPARWSTGSAPPDVPSSLARTMTVTRDTMVIRTFLCSTRYTQNEVLLKLFRFEQALWLDDELLRSTLQQLKYCSETEIAKHLRPVLDGLFGILASAKNAQHELSDLIFSDLITILAIIQDRRFTNFRPILELYISRHFSSSTAYTHLLRSLQTLLTKKDDSDASQVLRSALKVWDPLFRLIARSREIQRGRDVGMDFTHDHVEGVFRKDVKAVLASATSLMRASKPPSIIGTQILAIQNFASLIPTLARIFPDEELVEAVVSFCEAMPAATNKGKAAIWKLVLFVQIVKSTLLESSASRATLMPQLVRWVKPFLGRFDERNVGLTGKETEAVRDTARVNWLEANRLAASVLAALSDRLHTALLDPAIRVSRSLSGQEQDNAEYVLSLLPRLLDAYRDFDSASNLAALQRQRSVAASVPVVFPASYPFNLLTFAAARAETDIGPLRIAAPESKSSLSVPAWEMVAIVLALLHTAPEKILVNFLESAYEVEGKENFGRFLNNLFRFLLDVLNGAAWPSSWLNVNIFAHSVALKLAEPVSHLLIAHYIPPQHSSSSFSFSLWRDYLSTMLRLLASSHLVIEEFSPQKRRAVWKLAGDLRGRGSQILMRLWDALSDEELPVDSFVPRAGGYQVQLGPILIESTLELSLSHHDELRTNAVRILYCLILNEWNLNGGFSVIQTEVIDKLDKLFNARRRDEMPMYQALFLVQLKALFEKADLVPEARVEVNKFLDSVGEFLDLLFGIRSLPESEEWTDDRIVGTLKLMSFVRGVSASPIFVRYINQIRAYHVGSGHFAEAGLTLKLHADLYTWDATAFLDAIPDAQLARESHFTRKEALYKQIIDLLQQGRAYETAIIFCKELQTQYEKLYSYQQLSDNLAKQSQLYGKIMQENRVYPMYFRVGFYGRGFPSSVQNRQFVYLGNELERLPAFCERMQNKHPKATLLTTITPLDAAQLASEGQLLQITGVAPEPDKSNAIFSRNDAPAAARAYYEANDTNHFYILRPYEREVDSSWTGNAAALLQKWTEKTVLVCHDAFPAVLRRSEVLEVQMIDQSPIELALIEVEAKTKELSGLERRYLLASQVEHSFLNTNILTAALNAALDTGEAGVPLYRKIFFSPQYAAENDDSALVERLREAVDQQYRAIERCMFLHKALCPPEMRPFHDSLERFLSQHYAEERARLPSEPFPPENMTFPLSPSTARIVQMSDSSADGRIRRGSASTTASQSDTTHQSTVNGLHTLQEQRPSTSGTLNINGHAARFSETLVSQDSLRPASLHSGGTPPRSPNGPSSLHRSPSEKAANRLSMIGSRIGDSLRRKKSSAAATQTQ